jgi:MotA/TolQ/ExbB proton channel family
MESPYLPPSSPDAPDPERGKKRRYWKRMIWGTVIGMLLIPALGVAGTVIGMIGAFDELSQKGGADPEALAGSISTSLWSTFYGLLFCIPGLILLIVSIIRFRASGPQSPDQR